MNRNPKHHPLFSTEPAVAACRDGEFGGRTYLRQILSRFGLHANDAQETMLLDLINRSHQQKQYTHC